MRRFITGLLCILMLLASCLAIGRSLPQKTKPLILTLHDAVLLAMRNNPSLKVAELNRITQKYALVVEKYFFQPQYSFTAGFVRTENGDGTRTNKITFSPSVSLNTSFGTNFKLSMANTIDRGGFEPSATLSITQPLIKGFGEDIVLQALRNALDTEIVNKLNLKSTTIDTVNKIVADYFQVVQAKENLQADLYSLKRLNQTLDYDKKMIAAGRQAKQDIVQPQAQIASAKVTILNDKNTLRQNRFTLLNDLGLKLDANIQVSKKIDFDEIAKLLTGKHGLPAIDKSQTLALENNISYLTLGITLRSTARALVKAENDQKWDLEFSASQQVGGSTSVDELWKGGEHREFDLGVNLTVPINDLTSKQTLVAAKVALDQADINYAQEKRQLKINTFNQYHSVINSKQQLESSKQAFILQQKNLDIAKKKYKAGLISTFELLQNEGDLTTSEIAVISAKISYVNALLTFDKQIGVTLDYWDIKVRY